MKDQPKKQIRIKVYNHIHTLVEIDENRYLHNMPGAYLGHKGFVLKKIERITETLVS